MPLTAAQHRHYWEKGWLVVDGVFAREGVEAAAEHALALARRVFDPGKGAYWVDASPDGKNPQPRKLERPFEKDTPFFGQLIFSSPLPGLIEQLIGAPPLLGTDQVFLKPPHHGSPKAYHQDNGYFLCHPDDLVITAWIAMDDVSEENGCLRYIDGSHLGPILPSVPVPGREHDLSPDPALIDLTKESLAIVGKGGVVFHHSRALHTSGENRSSRWRRGYATHWVGPGVTSENGTLDNAYYKNPRMWDGWGEKYRPSAEMTVSS